MLMSKVQVKTVLMTDRSFRIQKQGGKPPETNKKRATITQALVYIKKLDPITGKLRAHAVQTKLDSGAIINIAHSSHCKHIKLCSAYNLPPVRLSGIGGDTPPLRKVGIIEAEQPSGPNKTALAYILDTPVAGNSRICLLGLRTLVAWDIDLTCLFNISKFNISK